MKKAIIPIVFVVTLILAIFIGTAQRSEDSEYVFQEPPELYWMASAHISIDYPCAPNATNESIREFINGKGDYYSGLISTSDVNQMVIQCNQSTRFVVDSRPLPPEIQSCRDELTDTVKSRGITKDFESPIIRECFIRDYSLKQMQQKIPDPEQKKVSQMLVQRDASFIEFASKMQARSLARMKKIQEITK